MMPGHHESIRLDRFDLRPAGGSWRPDGLQAKSLASLIAVLLFGIAILLCGWWMAKGVVTAVYVALSLAGFLVLFFGYRFVSAGKFMPAGMMTVLSLLAIFFLLLGLFSER